MKILSDVYEAMIRLPSVPPETGGIIGIKDGVVCDFCIDVNRPEYGRAVYTPNVDFLNGKIREWKKRQISFAGMFHSHKEDQPELSSDDTAYINTVVRAMPKKTEYLFFPIVIPNLKMLSFKAALRYGGVEICEDEIIILKELEMNTKIKEKEIKLPCGKFCGHNCADGCIYWSPYDRDSNGRQYCSYYRSYYYPRERQGCLSYKD